MAYFVREPLEDRPALSARRPTINKFFLSAYTLTVYYGCEYACPYCDGWVYDPHGFSRSIAVPTDLPHKLEQELQHVSRGDLVAITALSDPYQAAERTYRLTRQVLQVLAGAGQPCLIMTKSPLVLDDIPLLRRMNERSLAIVMTTLLTTDATLATRLEGRAPAPALRLDMLATLHREGIPTGVALVPLIPYVNDSYRAVRQLLQACQQRGIDFTVWDYLYIPDRAHRNRVSEMLAHVGSFPSGYYRDLYGDQVSPNPRYRSERDRALLHICDDLNLPAFAPHRLYAGKLDPRNEAALLLRHTALRSQYSGLQRMADLHHELADLVYAGTATEEHLRSSVLWQQIQPLLLPAATPTTTEP